MTGLLNKVEFQQASDRELAQRSPRKAYCFTIIDLDHFKQINDTCGHEAGDTLIIEFAKILTETFGAEYLLGRLGGDEFGVFASLGETEAGDAVQEIQTKLHQVRLAMDKKEFAEKYKELKPSFSSGTVRAEAEDRSFDSLYRRADALLYRSKNSGRSRDEVEESR
jgi:diguanylate cyclase (GGDEF)-like protein